MAIVNEESFGIIPLRHSGDEWSVLIILHKHGNHWGFPKGKPDEGEAPIESAIRELEEETGLKVERLLQEDPIVESYTFYRGKDKVYKIVSYFPGVVSGALLLQPEEIRDGKWVHIEEANEVLTFQEAKNICDKVQQSLRQFPK